MAQQVSSQDLERAMQTHNLEDSEIDQLMEIDISVGSSDGAASVAEPSTSDFSRWSAEIDQFMAAIIIVFQNPECCNLSDQSGFWTAVLAFMDPDHEVFQALNPVREIQTVYKRLRAPAIRKYGDMADLRGLFAKGKKKRATVLKRLKQEHAGPGENKPVQGKHRQGERLQRDKASRKRQRRAVKMEKRKMFHLQGLGDALPNPRSRLLERVCERDCCTEARRGGCQSMTQDTVGWMAFASCFPSSFASKLASTVKSFPNNSAT